MEHRFIHHYIYGQPVTIVSFCRSEKNSTKQALSNLEPLYKCIKLTGKKKYDTICQLSQTNNKQTNKVNQTNFGTLNIK